MSVVTHAHDELKKRRDVSWITRTADSKLYAYADSSAASKLISTPVNALLMGQLVFASSAADLKPASSIPSTSPRTVNAMPVSLNPPLGSEPRIGRASCRERV